MNIQQLTYPTSTVLSLQEAKDHLRVTTAAEDSVIMDCIRAATGLVERYTNQFFQSGSCVVYLDASEFSSFTEIKVWAYPVNEVTSVKYLDTNGVEQTFSSANYSTDLSDSPLRILPTTIPTIKQNVVNPYRIYLNVGYLNRDHIPYEVLSWVKILTGFFYETRQSEYTGNVGNVTNEIKYSFERALDKYRKDPIV